MIYNNPYAYLVRTRWDKKSKKVKQKVSKYLGKIYYLEKVRNVSFFEFYNDKDVEKYSSETPLNTIIMDLVRLEFYRHGFECKSSFILESGDQCINIDNIDKVYAINDGFMNKNTLRQILKYDSLLEEGTKNVPFRFAALFINAGISIDKELFIQLYQRFFSDNI